MRALPFARQALMCSRKLSAGERADDRQLTTQRGARTDLCKCARMAGAEQAHQFEASALTWQTRATANRADNKIGQRHGGVERAIVAFFETRHANSGL